MIEMIQGENVRCKYPITEINGMKLACNGKHPTHIHEEVMESLRKGDPAWEATISRDTVPEVILVP